MAFAAFVVHYWLPFRFKEVFWVCISLAGSFVFLDSIKLGLRLIGTGLVIFGILRSKLPFKLRAFLVAAVFAALICCSVIRVPHIPPAFYPAFGSLFMFRIIIYVYDLAHSKETPRLLPFLSYFFVLPNYLLAFFPVIDFQTMRHTYYRRNIHDIAQLGIRWMMRGAIQLALYRVVVFFNDKYMPDKVASFEDLAATIILTYLLYLNVSGHFHIAIGMLHLFGYDLPETNRRYLLASSVMDFWRRINIYWKDFMVKIVYFPVYFRLRRKGDLRAHVLATAAVFQVTLLLHGYQFFWTQGQFELTVPDVVFFNGLGLAAICQVLYDNWRKRRGLQVRKASRLVQAFHVLLTFAFISTLWFFWSAHSARSGLYLFTHWTQVRR